MKNESMAHMQTEKINPTGAYEMRKIKTKKPPKKTLNFTYVKTGMYF